MGRMEQNFEQRFKKYRLQQIILHLAAITGVIAVAAIAPNSLILFDKLGLIPSKRQKELINRSRDRLIKSGDLARSAKGYLEITKRGKIKLAILEHEIKRQKSRHWDKKWRMLIFDIREYRRATRDKLRETLQRLGFRKVQYSVWVYPYDCEDFVALLKSEYKIGKNLLYMIVDSIEDDRVLRKHFDLPTEW